MLRERVRVRQRGFTFYANDVEILKRVSSPSRLPFYGSLEGFENLETALFPNSFVTVLEIISTMS